MSVAVWACASVTAVSAIVSLGYSVAALRGSGVASRVSSMYAFARSLALAAIATLAVPLRSVAFLEAVALAMVLVQAFDAVVGVVIRDRLKTFGPAATSFVNAVFLVWLLYR